MEALAKRRKWFSLAAVNIGNFVPPLDTGIMSLILPTISMNLKAPIPLVLWVPLESLIITAAFMPIFGRFSDAHGRKRYFILGLALFSIGAYLSGNSITIYDLLTYRIIQSLGGAFILSNGRALIVDAFEPRQRGFALGTHISVIYIGMTVGVALTGTIVNITQSVGWRYVFYAGSAIALIAIPISLIALKESPKNLKIKTDWLGAIFFAGAWVGARRPDRVLSNGSTAINIYIQDIYIPFPFFHFYVYLNRAFSIPRHISGHRGHRLDRTLHNQGEDDLAAGHQLPHIQDQLDVRVHQLLGPLRLHGALLHADTALVLPGGHQARQPPHAGLLLTVEPLSVTVFALFGGYIASRTASRDPAVAGTVMVAAALLLLSTITETTSTALIAFLLAMLGAGVGIFAPTNTNANLASVPPGDRASANGILGMMRSTGQSISLAHWDHNHGLLSVRLHLDKTGGTFTPGKYIMRSHLTSP